VSLQWTAPNDNGGLAIDGYVIKYGVAGSNTDQYLTEHVDPETTSHALSGKLKPTTSYQFTVAAVNKAGEGPLSDFSHPIQTNSGN